MFFIVECIHDITTSYGLVISMLLAGLVGGATHCAFMCSPFVLAQIDGQQNLHKLKSAMLLPYHLGRMSTYVALAVLLNSVINLAFLFSDLKAIIAAPMLILAGIIFLINAFPKLSILFPWAANIRVSLPYKIIVKFSEDLTKSTGILGRYALGVLLGFMPCGLVLSALLASATAPNILGAALAMLAFAVGTMPALIFVAFGAISVKSSVNGIYPNIMRHAAKGAMLISAIWLFILAGTMIL